MKIEGIAISHVFGAGGGTVKIEIKDSDKPKRRNGIAVAMLKRHPRKQVMRDRRKRRAKDRRNHWSKEWE